MGEADPLAPGPEGPEREASTDPPARPSGDSVRRNPVPSLLTSLLTDHLDHGYAAAARRRGGDPPRGGRAYLLVGLLLAGLTCGIAARRTEENAPSVAQTRAALLADIEAAQARQSTLSATAGSLASAVDQVQAQLGAGGPADRARAAGAQAALTELTGPGLQIVIDNGPAGSGGKGQILDRDLQLLINGLWSAGAEAISVGGVRLGVTSAIRQAGAAILVDNRPVFWPVTIQAVGDPAKLHVGLVDTPGFARFSGFVSLYGIRFDLTTQQRLQVPAGAVPEQTYATPITGPSR